MKVRDGTEWICLDDTSWFFFLFFPKITVVLSKKKLKTQENKTKLLEQKAFSLPVSCVSCCLVFVSCVFKDTKCRLSKSTLQRKVKFHFHYFTFEREFCFCCILEGNDTGFHYPFFLLFWNFIFFKSLSILSHYLHQRTHRVSLSENKFCDIFFVFVKGVCFLFSK